ncbi:MAG: serine hydrolase, partial [Candidatus Marinimicrobia bacterium]|nr:serine hydrolase [Candidatus Neomarinimicrobiota bacterium]
MNKYFLMIIGVVILYEIIFPKLIYYPHEYNSQNIQELLESAVQDSAFPGGVLIAGNSREILINKEFGFHTYSKKRETKADDIFDLASITKVISTTSATMKLFEFGKLNLDDQVIKYIPQFEKINENKINKRDKVKIKHLLTHTSGLPPFRLFYKMESPLDSVYSTKLRTAPEEKYVYSDIGIIILGKIIENISEQTLAKFTTENIFQPLEMNSTFFNPVDSIYYKIVPTEYSEEEGKFIKGHVHDENAYCLNGIAGHAGLFSTARDLAKFSQMMLNNGKLNEVKIFDEETVKLFTKKAEIIKDNSRCLGWDSPDGECSGGIYLGKKSFGHTGFTGTSLWIDPTNDLFVILLTNAVHPNRSYKSPKYYQWRQLIHSKVYE